MSTRDEILEGDGFEYGLVLAIEGWDKLITNRADLSAMLDAWSDTPWSEAISGLSVEGHSKQSIQPWDFGLDVSTLTFRVQDEDDALGIAAWKRPGQRTELTEELDSADDDVIHVQGDKGLGSLGVAFVGGERVEVSPWSTTELNIEKRGTLAPLRARGTEYVMPRSHRMPDDERKVGKRPKVTSEIGSFIGARVGLWLHKIDGGVWADKSDAELIFAGTVGAIDDSGDAVSLRCDDLRRRMDEVVLFQDQYRAQLQEGIDLQEFDYFEVSESDLEDMDNQQFVVVGEDIAEGRYSLLELIVELNAALANLHDSGDIDGQHTLNLRQTNEGQRVQWFVSFDDLGSREAHLGCNREDVLEFLGYQDRAIKSGSGVRDFYYLMCPFHRFSEYRNIGDAPPKRNIAFRKLPGGERDRYLIRVENESGQWYDFRDWLPHPLDREAPAVGDFGLARLGSRIVLARRTPLGNFFVDVPKTEGPIAQSGSDDESFEQSIDDEGRIEFVQIAILAGAPSELIPRLLASIDGEGVNHSIYDELPFGAGIPWEVLDGGIGEDIVQDLRSIESDTEQGSMVVVLEEPTELGDILLPESQLRYMFMVWRKGRYAYVSPPDPNAWEAKWTLDDTNKAKPIDDGGKDPTDVQYTDEYLSNVIEIEYNRDLISGDYVGQPIAIINEASRAEYGERRMKISARNSYAQFSEGDDDVDELAAGLAARMAPIYGRPLWVATRSINGRLALAAPGDIVAMTDRTARNPVTGERGMTSRAGTILSHWFDWAQNHGEVRVLFSEEDRTFPVAPSADLVSYDEETDTIQISENNYAFRFLFVFHDDIDDFNVGDRIDVIEKNAIDPLIWTNREITDRDEQARELALGAPLNGFDESKSYRIVATHYADASPAHRVRAYQASKHSGLIDQQEEPNTFGHYEMLGFAPATAEDPPELIPDRYHGDGAPLSSGLLMTLSRNVNNLIQHSTALNTPLIFPENFHAQGISEWAFTFAWEIYVGAGKLPAGARRMISVSPSFRSEGGGTMRVRLYSSRWPPRGELYAEGEPAEQIYGPSRFVEFSTTADAWHSPEPKDLEALYREDSGITYLTVLISGDGMMQGLDRLRLKGLE